MIEGSESGAGSGAESGSLPLTNGSGSGSDGSGFGSGSATLVRISGMALSNHSDLLALFSPRKVNLKISLIPEDDLRRMSESQKMLTENGQIPKDD
jgi:hypothetical protein